MSKKPPRRKQATYDEKETVEKKEPIIKTKPKKENVFLGIVFCICLIVAIQSGKNIIFWFIDNNRNAEIIESISTKVTVEQMEGEREKYHIDFDSLKKINEDTVGWVKVYGTDIEFPVVQSEDNSYYLTHNFEKKNNVAGWIFADYRNKFDETDKNIIIYGHNRKDKSMFATLKNVLNNDWYTKDENRIIVWITENEYSLYEVFSVYQILNEDYYITTDFSNISYSDFLKRAKAKSIYDFGIDVTEEDTLLTLSTCADNNKYRVVLQAKKIKE